MSEELKRYFESIDSGMFPCDKGEEGEWVKYKDAQSQLSQYKAHVDVLWNALRSVKPVIQTLAVDRGNGPGAEKLFNSVQEALSQSPATSLAQVEAESVSCAVKLLRENFNPHDEDEHLAHQRIDAFLIEYANNLKEQGL